MPTRTIGSWEDGQITATLDYDNQNRITSIRVVNNSPVHAYLEVQEIASGRTAGKIFLSGTDTNISVPTGQANKIEQFVNPSIPGGFDGLNIRAVIPAP